jgi:carbonic anhydrase/acetyltransferase-like protein (isoleucine patch superfamily)
MAFGRPAKVVRTVTPEEIASNRNDAAVYIREKEEFR